MGPPGSFTSLPPTESSIDQPRLDLDVRTLGAASQLTVNGELDLATAPRLEEALDWLRATRCRRVVLDLHGVTFCDCAGLSVLVEADTAMSTGGGHLVICGPSSSLRRLLGITHLDDTLDID
jgi:anti-sigma B factor antagonist